MSIPTISRWNKLGKQEQLRLTKSIANGLPNEFEFLQLREFSLGEAQGRIALFHHAELDSTFALVPGGDATLGFDASSWTPNPDELESWSDTAEEYDIADSLPEYVAKATTKKREAVVGPMLVETAAKEVGWETIDVNDPRLDEMKKQFPREPARYEVYSNYGNRQLRISRESDRQMRAVLALETTHASLCAAQQEQGFRFPTSDEWEYLCGGGSTALFRWGDHAPCDRYPTDISPEEAAWRRAWVLSGGKLEYPAEEFQSDWNDHRQPNGYGLFVAENPYKCEVVADDNMTRGGDGGSTICGGAGFFVGWLTLATSYFEDFACMVEPDAGLSAGYVVGRRVLDVDL